MFKLKEILDKNGFLQGIVLAGAMFLALYPALYISTYVISRFKLPVFLSVIIVVCCFGLNIYLYALVLSPFMLKNKYLSNAYIVINTLIGLIIAGLLIVNYPVVASMVAILITSLILIARAVIK